MAGLIGRWRIVGMELFDPEDVDLVEPGFIEFTADGHGEFGFIAVRGAMDWRATDRDGRPGAEFSWDGIDECDQANGRGWATLTADGMLEGRIFIHLADDSAFQAVPFDQADPAG
ncbi:hypothetical protein [Flindersiella endophytica]